jgi:hypothetical protein
MKTISAYVAAGCVLYVLPILLHVASGAPVTFPGDGLGWWLVIATATSVAVVGTVLIRQRRRSGAWRPVLFLSCVITCWLIAAAASSVLFTTSLTGMVTMLWCLVAIPVSLFANLLLLGQHHWWALGMNLFSILPGALVGVVALPPRGAMGDTSSFMALSGWLLLDLAVLLTVATVRARFAARLR